MNTKTLPTEFVLRMKDMLGNEYEEFEKALLGSRSYGLRLNPLKIDDFDAFLDCYRDTVGIKDRVPWAGPEGFYYDELYRPGKNPLHEAGAYYIQEPSAMSVVELLAPQPGEKICDLCAAPGGKTTHIAGRMKGLGLLVSNEIVGDRARILARNVERMGIKNCLVVNESPDVISRRFISYFHRVVVDAPCSGEGMFRKDDIAISEWSPENVLTCIDRQKEILNAAAMMVMPGGTMVYSTCTFEKGEDEEMMEWFVDSHPDWKLECTRRIWPHKERGEGHFVAKLVRDGNIIDYLPEKIIKNKNKSISINDFFVGKSSPLAYAFGEKMMNCFQPYIQGEHVYMLNKEICPELIKKLKIVKPGLEVAEIKKDRLEPSHSLAMALKPSDVKSFLNLSDEQSAKYLWGETIVINENELCFNDETVDRKKGFWILVCVHNISIGWAKYVNGTLKNHYPKGLRKTI